MAKNSNINAAASTLQQSAAAYAQQNFRAPTLDQLPNFSSMSGGAARDWIKDKISHVDQSEKLASSTDRDAYRDAAVDKQKLAEARRILQEKEKTLKIEQKTFGVTSNQVTKAKDDVNIAKAKVTQVENEYKATKRTADLTRQASHYRKAEYDNVRHAASNLSSHLDNLDKKRQNSLGSHLLHHRNLSKGLQSYGSNKLLEGGLEGSMGGMALGGAALAGGAIVAALVDAVMGNIKHSIEGSGRNKHPRLHKWDSIWTYK
jgi:hypothetical protein